MKKTPINKLSIVIMAHPDRKEMAELLSAGLGGIPIVWDEKNNVWDTCKRAWQAIDKTAEYGLVLQDDVIPCTEFVRRAESLLTEDYLYNFFIHSGFVAKVEKAISDGQSGFFTSSIFGEIALCMPIKYINGMINYCESKKAQSDTVISSWAITNKVKIYYPIPSLVDHRAGDSIFLKNTGQPQREKPHQGCCFADNYLVG